MAALAALVGLWRPAAATIGPDETVYQASGLAYVTGDLTPNPEHPPLAKVLMGLWQLAFGEGIVSVRVLMGLVLVATAMVAFLWLRAALGRAEALTATALLITMHRVAGADFVDRQVSLDPFAVLFGVTGLALLSRWRERPTVLLAVLAGAAFACAMLSKAVGAVFLAGALAAVPWRRLDARSTLLGIGAFAATGVAVCLAAFWPFGGLDAVAAMVEFQASHAERGHRVEIAGTVHQHAPLHAVAWLAGATVGVLPLVGIVLGVTAACLAWRQPAARMLVVTAVATFVVLSLSPVALQHYTADWLWAAVLASGIGVVTLWRRAGGTVSELAARVPARAARVPARSARVPELVARVLVAAVPSALLLVGAVAGLWHVLTLEPRGVGLVDERMRVDPRPDGTVLTIHVSPLITAPNIAAPVTVDPATDGITAVLVGEDVRHGAPQPALLAALDALEQPQELDGLRLYLLDDELDDLGLAALAVAP